MQPTEEQMPRIEELTSEANDLYWQIEDWMSDFDIPEDRVNEALTISAQLGDELAKLAKDSEIRRHEETPIVKPKTVRLG